MKKMNLLIAGFVALPAAFASASTIKDLSAKGAKNQYCDFDITVPQLFPDAGDNIAGLAKLNAKWRKDFSSDIQGYKESIAEQDSCKDEMSGYNVSRGYELKEPKNGRILSIVFTESIYSGGAHPNGGYDAQVVDTVTGERFEKLSAFVDDAKMPAITRILDQVLPKIDEGFDATFGWNEWKKSHKRASDVDNFYFSDKGLTLVFNQYEIASYAEGILEPTISWAQLRRLGLLKSTGPATLLFQTTPAR